MVDFCCSHASFDHSYIRQQSLNSLCMQPGVYAPAYLPTQVTLTGEGVLGDRQLIEIGKLQDGWDGYDGAAIDASVVGASREYFSMLVRSLPAPDFQPNSNGTISFEWTTTLGSAQLEIGSSEVSLYIKPSNAEPVFVKNSASASLVATIGHLIRFTLFENQQSDMTAAATFGSRGDWKSI